MLKHGVLLCYRFGFSHSSHHSLNDAGSAQAATGHFHGRLWCHHYEAEGDVSGFVLSTLFPSLSVSLCLCVFVSVPVSRFSRIQMITLGGDAELELVDRLNPFSEGIQFSVRPPKKSWKNISNLSGGEKTLSSLALVFALHHYKPTPLYVMDEIDAALDFKNVSIVANYIKVCLFYCLRGELLISHLLQFLCKWT